MQWDRATFSEKFSRTLDPSFLDLSLNLQWNNGRCHEPQRVCLHSVAFQPGERQEGSSVLGMGNEPYLSVWFLAKLG